MTKYTADDHALPYPEGGDKVAVHGDIQALAIRTGIAITISESAARVAAGNYTDGVARSLRTDLTAYTDATKWERGLLTVGSDLGALIAPGVYYANTGTIVRGILDTPAGTTQPFTVEVKRLSHTNGVQLQTLTEYTSTGPKVSTRLSLSNKYAAWTTSDPGASADALAWDRGALSAGANLNTLLKPGVYRADRYSISETIIGTPAGTTQPFTVEVRQLSTPGNGVFLQTLTEWRASGPVTNQRISVANQFGNWDAPGGMEPAANRLRVATFGDSLTDGGSAGDNWADGENWPSKLALQLPGVTVTNMGRSGDTTDEVLIRAGAVVVRFRVGSIPASGGVELASDQVLSVRAGRSFAGTVAGIYGLLRRTESGGWLFTRAAPGTVVPVAAGTPLEVAGINHAGDTLIFWAGRNDISFGTPGLERTIPDHVIASHQTFLEWARPRVKAVVFPGVTTARAERAGTPGFETVREINNRLRSMYPGKFADVQRWLSQDALGTMGLTPTSEDAAATAAGEIPPQLYADTLHFTRATAAALAEHFFAPYLKGRGLI